MTLLPTVTKALVFSLALAVGGVLLSSCEREGPAERAGDKIDESVDKLKEKVDPSGPAEKAGKKLDNAVDDLKD
jgi:hypothetical protein